MLQNELVEFARGDLHQFSLSKVGLSRLSVCLWKRRENGWPGIRRTTMAGLFREVPYLLWLEIWEANLSRDGPGLIVAIGIGGKIADEAENWGPVTMAARLRLFEIDAGVVWLDRGRVSGTCAVPGSRIFWTHSHPLAIILRSSTT